MVFPAARLPVHRLNLALLTLLLVLLLGLFLRTALQLTGGRLGAPLDDAWIHYQFARNLAQGEGFSYNPGEPTPGSTAPLWTVALAGVGLFAGEWLLPSLLLSALFLLIAAWLVYGFTVELAGNWRTGLLAALGVIFTGRLLWVGLAGLETTAFAAVSVAAVWAYHRQGLRPLPALLFALGGQLRPEGHALFALAIADSLLAARLPGRRLAGPDWRGLTVAVGIYALIAAPYALFSLATTGRPLPNTFYAKAGAEHFFSFRALRETLAYHWQDNPVAFLLIPLGLVPAARRSRLVVAWLLALPLLTALIVDLIWHHGRYTLPLIPFQMIVAALGAEWLAQRDWLAKLGPGRRAVPALLLGVVVVSGAARLPYWAGMLGHNSNEILEIDVAMGQWLAEHTPPDAFVAVDDIGAITYLSERRILDLNGLVSPEMWPVIRGEAEGRPRNEAMTRLLSSIRPDYLAVFPVLRWDIATNPLVATPVQRFRVATHSIIFEQEAVVYEMTWPYRQQAAPQFGRVVRLGEAIQLLGFDFAAPPAIDQPLLLTLYWQSLAPVAEGYDVFVHVLDENGNIVAQADREPVAGLAPTHRWQPGDIIGDPYELALPAYLPAGNYRIQTGMFLRASGERLPASGADVSDNAILLTSFAWPAARDG